LLFSFPFLKGEFVDERDNWVGGYLQSRGEVIYKDFISHHAPLPYFLAIIPALISPQACWTYRLIIYLLFASVQVIMQTKFSPLFWQTIYPN
jgi:hypothetical protein